LKIMVHNVGAEASSVDEGTQQPSPSGLRLKPAPPGLHGLQRIARGYGAVVIQGKRFVWDYVTEGVVPAAEMKPGSARWVASERAKWCVGDGVEQQGPASSADADEARNSTKGGGLDHGR